MASLIGQVYYIYHYDYGHTRTKEMVDSDQIAISFNESIFDFQAQQKTSFGANLN